MPFFCFVFNWRDCTVKTGSMRKLGQSPIYHYPRSSAHLGYLRQFLTKLVQNLTLCNDCNLISSAHCTQWIVLSKRLLDRLMTHSFFQEFEHMTFGSEVMHSNQYNMSALTREKCILVTNLYWKVLCLALLNLFANILYSFWP